MQESATPARVLEAHGWEFSAIRSLGACPAPLRGRLPAKPCVMPSPLATDTSVQRFIKAIRMVWRTYFRKVVFWQKGGARVA
ncbi:hypothetical protein GCM10009837_16440 [Streptomyces durmitorensis]